jgi:hypothetical protein
MKQCANKFNRSTASIKKFVDEAKGTTDEQLERFVNEIEQIKSNHSKEILASISDNVSLEIIDKYKAKLAKDKILDGALIGKYKIQPIMNTIGMLYDKGLKVSELALKMREIEKGENTDKLFLNEVEKYSANMVIKEDYALADENIKEGSNESINKD